MRCTYRPDVVVQDSLLIPSWKFDSQKSFEHQPNIQWHANFIPAVHKSRQSRDHVSSVCVKALLIPNMLDMDIIMAMSRIESEDLPVFSKLSIQGIVHCLWENLFQVTWNLFETLLASSSFRVLYCFYTCPASRSLGHLVAQPQNQGPKTDPK